MKKYIIIAGAPRSGKSTIASMISKKYNYQHISMDNILAGIENVFPETGINTNIEISSQNQETLGTIKDVVEKILTTDYVQEQLKNVGKADKIEF